MENRTYYYARVSTKEQNLDRQLNAFRQFGATDRDIVTDKESGKSLDRSGYQALKTTILRQGDTLVIKSLDRLSRNKGDIRAELQYFKEHGIRVKIIDLPTTMTDFPVGQEWVLEMVNNILIEVLGTIAEQERTTIRQRQREGIESARSKGKHLSLLILLIGIAAIGTNRAICYRVSASWAKVFHELTSNLFQHFGFLCLKFSLCEHTVILEFDQLTQLLKQRHCVICSRTI